MLHGGRRGRSRAGHPAAVGRAYAGLVRAVRATPMGRRRGVPGMWCIPAGATLIGWLRTGNSPGSPATTGRQRTPAEIAGLAAQDASISGAASPGGSVTRYCDWAGVRFMVAPAASRSSAAGSRWTILTAVFFGPQRLSLATRYVRRCCWDAQTPRFPRWAAGGWTVAPRRLRDRRSAPRLAGARQARHLGNGPGYQHRFSTGSGNGGK
jgi:hypothetical protein